MPDFSDIPDEAVEAGARAAYAKSAEWDKADGTTKAIELRRARLTLAAALPVLNTARDASPDIQSQDEYRRLWMHRFDRLLTASDVLDGDDQLAVLNVHEALLAEQYHNHRAALASRQRPALVSGDVPITERTPHGVWIADGPDPEPSLDVPCAGLSGCDTCRAYADLRQHLVKQIIALDEQYQREMAALSASRDSETAKPELVMGTKPDGSPWVVSAEFARSDVRVDGHGALRLHGKAISPHTAHKLATGLLAAIAWLENDGAAKAEAAASLRGEPA